MDKWIERHSYKFNEEETQTLKTYKSVRFGLMTMAYFVSLAGSRYVTRRPNFIELARESLGGRAAWIVMLLLPVPITFSIDIPLKRYHIAYKEEIFVKYAND
jgi:hypothetical protein